MFEARGLLILRHGVQTVHNKYIMQYAYLSSSLRSLMISLSDLPLSLSRSSSRSSSSFKADINESSLDESSLASTSCEPADVEELADADAKSVAELPDNCRS